MCDDRTAKQNIACVGVCACDRMPLTARPDIDKLDDTVNEYNNTYQKTIKMKPVDVKDNTYIDSTELHSNKEVNDKDPKFKVGDHVRISKYKNIFAKGYTPNWSEEVFVIKKLKTQFHGHMLLMI